MNKPLILSAVLAVSASVTSITTQAEILSIGSNAKVLTHVNLPKHGQTMKKVSNKFGAASKVSVSKGKITKKNPKITRWDYPTFSVYFENSHVIHSVVKR